MHTPGAEASGFIGILLIQITFLIIYGIFVRYDYEMLPLNANASQDEISAIEQQHKVSYPRELNSYCTFNSIFIISKKFFQKNASQKFNQRR